MRAIKADLALEGVARAEKIEVTADELGAEITSLAQAYGRDSEGAREPARPKRSDRDAGRRYHQGARRSTCWSNAPISTDEAPTDEAEAAAEAEPPSDEAEETP